MVVEGVAAGEPIAGLGGAVWADSDNDGRVDGYVRFGRYRAGTPPGYDPVRGRVISRNGHGPTANGHGPTANGHGPPRPPPPPPPPAPERSGDDDDFPATDTGPPTGSAGRPGYRAYRASATRRPPMLATAGDAGESGLAAIQLWYSRNGTLTRRALEAMVNECQASGDGLTSDCRDAVNEGAGNFRIVPGDARREFVKLFDDSCPASRGADACLQEMHKQRLFRGLARAKLDPRPLTMNEGMRTRFTARLRDSGTILGVSGARTDVGVESDATAPGGHRTLEVMPYSEHMCFRLASDDPKKAKIEPVAQQGGSLEGDKLCMDVNEGGAEIKYEPSWFVTPRSGSDLNLLLDAEYDVQGVRQLFRFQPRPIVVDVIPKPGLWDRIDGAIRRMTATVNLAVGLAEALGTLFTVVAGWLIWRLFKWRKARGAGPQSARSPRRWRRRKAES